MKVNARKKYSTFKKELSKTGGGARPATPNDGIIEIKDLLNPAELLRDHNIYDSDGIIESSSSNKVILAITSETCDNTLQDVKPMTYVVKYLNTQNVDENINPENQQIADNIIENADAQENAQEFTSSVVSQDAIGATPMNKNMGRTSIKVPKRKLISNNKKNHDDYVNNMLSHSKKLKEEEHRRRLEMAEEEHAIKIEIHKEKLNCAILEREILELRKVREEQN
ncbi:unnamed protein product [Parnassius apollo]|uniref:(apollo) hypothetical protein n=1 Tax=Parnassius apollo TaxID=110799 RepID=A0A8S3XJ75_PARAO|nr:unnamed protein product [Parnassius apollo]